MAKTLFLLGWIVLLEALPLSGQVTSGQARKYSKELENLILGKRELGLKEFIQEMAGLDDPKVVGLIPVAAAGFPSAANHALAVKAIQGLQKEACIQELVSILKKPKVDYRQCVVILEGFGRRTDPPTLAAILEHLKSKSVHVQVAAIRACRERKVKETIPTLIDLLEKRWKSRDRALIETREALLALTGRDYETVDDWRKFWGTVPADFDPKEPGKESGPTVVKVTKTESSVEFFGSEIFSQNLLFVIDVSGSMIMYDESPEYDGNDVEKDRQRLNRARDQLTRALRKLPRAARFNIITFSDKLASWKKQMLPATPENVAGACKFVGEFNARGATHTDEALESAFGDIAVDTIVLLSDGAPMKEGAREPQPLIKKILERVKDLNASRRVKIETFGFEGVGRWPSKVPWGMGRLPPPPSAEETKAFVEFLQTLAAENGGGTYRAIQ